MGTYTIDTTLTLVTETCCNCSVIFAMPTSLQRRVKQDGTSFYCPNGHGQHYTISEIDKLKKQLAEKDASLGYYRGRVENLNSEKDHYKRVAAANKGQVTKMKNRAANGVCQCCNRTFQNLQRHMATKHPDFAIDGK